MPPRVLSKNWILEYAEAMDARSESPNSFIVWAGISAVSSVLKKHVFLKRGIYDIYPNQYIVLVAPPGIGKGEAIHPAHGFLKGAKPPLANYISDRITAPRIIENLANGFTTTTFSGGNVIAGKESTATLMSTELPTLLGGSDWMLQFLCDAWDKGTFEYDTRNKGTFLVDKMCVSLIGACTPDYIRRLNRDATATVASGFTARTIFVFAGSKSKKITWPESLEDTAAGRILKQNLDLDLHAIARLQGEFHFTQTAAYIFEQYYKALKPTEDDSDVMAYFKSRQHIHVMKVAMCLSAASGDTLLIDSWELKTAIQLINSVLGTLDVTFRGVGESSLAEATARVQTIIEKKGMITRGELLKLVHRHVTPEDLDRLLRVLESIGFCRTSTIGTRMFYEHIDPKNVAKAAAAKMKGPINVGHSGNANAVNP